jgi:hypothetical protein
VNERRYFPKPVSISSDRSAAAFVFGAPLTVIISGTLSDKFICVVVKVIEADAFCLEHLISGSTKNMTMNSLW